MHTVTPVSAGSLWADTAQAGPVLQALQNDVQADVVIVGAGYSGLTAAHALQKRGVDAVVLDAQAIGWGASGRNGGVVAGKFGVSFPAIAKAHGLQVARQMHHISHEAVDAVHALIDELGIAHARLEMSGNLRCAHTEQSFSGLATEADWLRSQLGDRSIELLSRAEVENETGSTAFFGGLLNRHAGTIHPLNYVRGLASALAARGVRIHENSPVHGVDTLADSVLVKTPRGTVRARQILYATDAYSNLHRSTRRVKTAVIPFRSAIVATERLPESLAASLLVHGRSYSETRRMMKWFRLFDGRFVFGGRGAFGGEDSPPAFEALRRAMVGMFPALEPIEVAYRWSGLVGMTLDALPHVGRLDARSCVCLGFNGAGVAMASLLGQRAADVLVGNAPDLALLDARHLRHVPLYPLRSPGIRLVAGWYQLLDALGK